MIVSQELYQKLLAGGFPDYVTMGDPFSRESIRNMRRCPKLKAFSQKSAVNIFDYTDSGAFNPKRVYQLISLTILILFEEAEEGKLNLNLKRAIVIPIIPIVCYVCASFLLWFFLLQSWFIWFLCEVISFFPFRILIYSLYLSIKFRKIDSF